LFRDLTLCGKPAEMTVGEFWKMYRQTRKEMFRYFSKKHLNLRLEDIILINALFIKGLMKRNLDASSALVDTKYVFERVFATHALSELVAMIYVPLDRRILNFFVNRNMGDERCGLQAMSRFVKGKPDLGKKVLEHLELRLSESYIPEIDQRWYGTITPACDIISTCNSDDENNKTCLAEMQKGEIPREVIDFASSNFDGKIFRVFWELNDDIKNGCGTTGEVWLKIFAHSF
jgi:hypothetical protein